MDSSTKLLRQVLMEVLMTANNTLEQVAAYLNTLSADVPNRPGREEDTLLERTEETIQTLDSYARAFFNTDTAEDLTPDGKNV